MGCKPNTAATAAENRVRRESRYTSTNSKSVFAA
jgi:hypothetical protein